MSRTHTQSHTSLLLYNEWNTKFDTNERTHVLLYIYFFSFYIFSPLLFSLSLCVVVLHTTITFFFFFCINETLASTRPLWPTKKKRKPKGAVVNLFSRFPRKEALRVLPAADRARSQRHVTTKADISRSLVQAKSLDRKGATSKRKEKKKN